MSKLISELLKLNWCKVCRLEEAGSRYGQYFIGILSSKYHYVNDKGEAQDGAHWFETYTEAVNAAERYESRSKSWKLVLGPGVKRSDWDKIGQLIKEGQLEGDLK